jgi:hypothetical protein
VRTLALTVPRRSREALGDECQDAATAWSAGGRAVLVVADGVGSVKHSEIGARLATRVMAEHLAGVDRPAAVPRALTAGRKRWLDELARTGAPVDSVKTTLGFAIAKPPSYVIVGAVGDCFAFVTRTAEEPSAALVMDQGRAPGTPANEGVPTLGHDAWIDHLRWCTIYDPTIDGVGLSSDGLEPVTIDERPVENEHGRHVRQVTVAVELVTWLVDQARREKPAAAAAAELASWDELMTRTDDDLGVALATW